MEFNFKIRFILYTLILLLDFSQGLFTYRRLSKPGKLLTQLLGFTLLLEILSRIFWVIFNTTNPSYHILIPIQLFYFSNIYQSLEVNHRSKQSIKYSGLMAIAISIILSILNNVLKFPSYQLILLSTFVIIWSLGTFLSMLNRPDQLPIFRQFSFWFTTGNLLFYSLSFFVLSMMNLIQSSEQSVFSWGFEMLRIANYILYSLYWMSLYVSYRHSNSNKSLSA